MNKKFIIILIMLSVSLLIFPEVKTPFNQSELYQLLQQGEELRIARAEQEAKEAEEKRLRKKYFIITSMLAKTLFNDIFAV